MKPSLFQPGKKTTEDSKDEAKSNQSSAKSAGTEPSKMVLGKPYSFVGADKPIMCTLLGESMQVGSIQQFCYVNCQE